MMNNGSRFGLVLAQLTHRPQLLAQKENQQANSGDDASDNQGCLRGVGLTSWLNRGLGGDIYFLRLIGIEVFSFCQECRDPFTRQFFDVEAAGGGIKISGCLFAKTIV